MKRLIEISKSTLNFFLSIIIGYSVILYIEIDIDNIDLD